MTAARSPADARVRRGFLAPVAMTVILAAAASAAPSPARAQTSSSSSAPAALAAPPQLADTATVARTSVAAPPAMAQGSVRLQGRVLGPDGKPLAGQVVTIHRVDAAGGAAIAVDTSGADGGFEAQLQGAADGAIFFASAHYKGQLYIGPPFRGPIPRNEDYVLVVGTPATSGAALLKALDGGGAVSSPSAFSAAATPGQRQRANTWFWAALILSALLVLAGVGYVRTRRSSPPIPPLRAALMRLAAVEEHLSALGPDQVQARASGEAARARLRREVQRLAGIDAHAAR